MSQVFGQNMILFLILTVGIFFSSRLALREIYVLLRRFIDNNKTIFSVLALIFLPGTLIHETAHFITALFLLLPVKSMTVFPEFEDGEIRLGKVSFERRDFLRGVIVGVAPFFAGTALLFFMLSSNIFFEFNLAFKIIFLYLIFSISSNMFSSKADLRDLALILPVILLVVIVFYVLGIDINAMLAKGNFTAFFNDIMNKVNRYFLFVFLINFGLFVTVKMVNKFLSK